MTTHYNIEAFLNFIIVLKSNWPLLYQCKISAKLEVVIPQLKEKNKQTNM